MRSLFQLKLSSVSRFYTEMIDAVFDRVVCVWADYAWVYNMRVYNNAVCFTCPSAVSSEAIDP